MCQVIFSLSHEHKHREHHEEGAGRVRARAHLLLFQCGVHAHERERESVWDECSGGCVSPAEESGKREDRGNWLFFVTSDRRDFSS